MPDKNFLIYELLDDGYYSLVLDLYKDDKLIFHKMHINLLKSLARTIIYNTNLESEEQTDILFFILSPFSEYEFREFFDEIYDILFHKNLNSDMSSLFTLINIKYEVIENIKKNTEINYNYMKKLLYKNTSDMYLSERLAKLFFIL